MSVWVVCPTYNEAQNLPLIADVLLDMPLSAPGGAAQDGSHAGAQPETAATLLIVDDNSPDGTGALADDLASQHPGRVHVLHRDRKLGLGTAYRQGFRYALDHGAEAVVEMDADFSHSPSYLPQMARLLGDHDVVVGSRWCPGGRVDERWERWRYLLSKYANLYSRLVTGLHVYDTTAGFKTFRASALDAIPFEQVRSNGYAFQIEMAMLCQRAGLRVTELPIYFEERLRGRSKMSFSIIADAIWRVWQIRLRWARQ